MSNVTYIPGKESDLDKLIERFLSILEGKIPQRSRKELEISFRNRLERGARLVDGGIKLDLPSVPDVDPEIVRRVMEQARVEFTEEANTMITLLIGELMGLELENWQLQNGETD